LFGILKTTVCIVNENSANAAKKVEVRNIAFVRQAR